MRVLKMKTKQLYDTYQEKTIVRYTAKKIGVQEIREQIAKTGTNFGEKRAKTGTNSHVFECAHSHAFFTHSSA